MSLIIVTGAASGIGRASSTALEAAGYTVARIDRAFVQDGERQYALDVTDDAAVARLFAEIEAAHGAIDGLVNCAGVSGGGTLTTGSMELWDTTMAVNLRATAVACQTVLPGMIERGRGSIVNIGSTFGLVARNNCVAYSVSKAAVIQLTKCMAVDLADSGVRVNCVCPGLIETGMTQPLLDPEYAEYFAGNVQAHAMRRIGQPEEVAEMVAFLISDKASFMTGAAVPVDGGYTSGKWVD